MEAIYIDTHVAVWLFQNDLTKFSKKALRLMEKHDLLISPMAIMELGFLYEIGRVTYKPLEILSELNQTIDLKVCEEKFIHSVYQSINITWTKNPFDRLIVANASFNNAILISKDKNILDHYDKTVC